MNASAPPLRESNGSDGASSKRSHAYPDALLDHRAQLAFTIADFEIGRRPIGQGKFGTVYRVREKASRKLLVLKVISKRAILEEDVKSQLQREIEVHCRLVHPNIVRMYAYFTDAEQAYLLLEWANSGNLYEKLQAAPGKCIDEASAASYTEQLLRALAFCHSKNVIHRDIKPENLLLHKEADGSETLKLADFGWSVAQRLDSRRTTLCGTVEYLPPEVVAGEEYGFGFDTWTVGVLAYEMLVGRSPFFVPGGSQDDIMARIASGEPPEMPAAAQTRSGGGGLSPLAADFVGRLLVHDQHGRLSAEEALAHPWLAQRRVQR